MTEGRPLAIRVTAAVLIVLEVLTVALRGRATLGLARLRPHHGFGLVALLLLLAAVALAVLAAGVAADLRGARIAAAVAQAVLLVGSLVRLPARPVLSVLGVAVEVTVGVLLLVPTTSSRPPDRRSQERRGM